MGSIKCMYRLGGKEHDLVPDDKIGHFYEGDAYAIIPNITVSQNI